MGLETKAQEILNCHSGGAEVYVSLGVDGGLDAILHPFGVIFYDPRMGEMEFMSFGALNNVDSEDMQVTEVYLPQAEPDGIHVVLDIRRT